ncbi:MAG TPA: signal peptidase I [Verrucomicrobiae bacterium]|jgi:signal peptidase I
MIRWLFSKTVRDASAMHKQVYRMVCAQRDLMTQAAFVLVSDALANLRKALHDKEPVGKIREKMWTCEEVANKWLKPYPHPIWRENIEVLLVAIAVAMAIRTFFLQPFKIPTGSMQPTLFGVNSDNLMVDKKVEIPSGWQRVNDWFHGISYIHVVARADGPLQEVSSPVKFLIFNLMQTVVIGGVRQTIWFPPDYGEAPTDINGYTMEPLMYRAGLVLGTPYHKGDDVVKLEVKAGDHLFVDRVSYNFRKPARGDIVVFETKGIPEEMRHNPPYWNIPDDEFYIKRLVGLGGETITLNQDYVVTNAPGGGDVPVGNLVVNGKDLNASTPHFENLYSFDNPDTGAKIIGYHGDGYYGHAMLQKLAPGQEVQIRPNYLFVMGDNTMNSLDSRYWGDFPEQSIIGKSFFVYWPLSSRFGWGTQ